MPGWRVIMPADDFRHAFDELEDILPHPTGRNCDDDARMPKAARRPLQRFCALAALNHGGTPRRRLADPGGQGGVVLCDTARRRGT